MLFSRIIVLFCLLVFLSLGCSDQSSESKDFIVDQAGILQKLEINRIHDYHDKLLDELDVHLKVVVLGVKTADIDRKAVELFEQYALGSRTRGARGVLLLVDPLSQQVRMEIGYDLEPIFPDALVARIERNQMSPFFRSGKVGSGIEASVELLVAKSLNSDDFVSTSMPKIANPESLSGGAGARASVKFGTEGIKKTTDPRADLFKAQPTPVMTLEAYIQVLHLGITDPNLGLYTLETRQFFQKWLVTSAQQAHELQRLQRSKNKIELVQRQDLAVIRFPVGNRQDSPYFFRRGKEGWMLDFASLGQLVGFNHKNQWYFRRIDNEFTFAFSDLRFDNHGFPHAKKR